MSKSPRASAFNSVKVFNPVSELLVALPGILGGAFLGAMLFVGLPSRWFEFGDSLSAMLVWLGIFFLVVALVLGLWYRVLGNREFVVREQSLVIRNRKKVLTEISFGQIEQIQVLAPQVFDFNPLAWFLPQFGGVNIALRDPDAETFFVKLLLSRSSTAWVFHGQLLYLMPDVKIAKEVLTVEGNAGQGSWPK